MICCLWDAIAQWRHWARFRACERKLRRANDAFSNRRGDLLLCPHCVEPISSQPSPSKVVFLCGHRFHTSCCNAWFSESPGCTGRCPICEFDAETAAPGGEADADPHAIKDGCNDGAQSFVLRSLHRQFPDIIPEACVQRWRSCHTQIWLSELTCPKFNSPLRKQYKSAA